MAERTPVRFLELLRRLVEGEVEFIIVGGVAAVLEGAPVSTFDLDIVYAMTDENVERLASVLESLDAAYVDPAGRRISPDRDRLAGGGHHLLRTRLGRLDVMAFIGEEQTFEDLLKDSVERTLHDLSVRILSLAALISAKQAIGRPKDRAVLDLLKETLARRERSG